MEKRVFSELRVCNLRGLHTQNRHCFLFFLQFSLLHVDVVYVLISMFFWAAEIFALLSLAGS
jgi:hypothetical protein